MSDEIVKERKKPGPKPKLPVVSIIERRIKHPFGAPSVPITLSTAGQWAVRIVNTTMRTGRLHEVLQKGWTYVVPGELDGRPDELGFRVQDDRLVRGEKGEEVLVKMPQADFDAIASAKARLNIKNLGKQQTLSEAATQAGKAFGDQAGETIAKAHIEISDSRGPEALDEDGA